MISVVIPLYNKAHTIVNTLNTVLNQIYRDFEVVIVNDGSTDNGVEVIKQNFNDSRIRIINQKNAGVSAARNRGVEEAKGNWIAFLDGDDEWHPEYLSTMYGLIKKYPNAGLFLCAGLIHNADGSISYRIASKYEGKKCIINLFENPEVFSHTSGTIVNKQKFNQTHRFIKGMKKFEDYLMSQALSLITDTVYCGIPLTKYNGGISGQLTQKNIVDPQIVKSELKYFNTIMDDYYECDKNNTLCPIFVRYFLRHLIKVEFKKKNYDKIDYLLSHLSERSKSLLNTIDLFLIKNHLHYMSIIWINITKLYWRRYGFPIVGQNIKVNTISAKYLRW